MELVNGYLGREEEVNIVCLVEGDIREYKKPKDWVEGYKILIHRARSPSLGLAWQSEWAWQDWEFAEMVEAKGAGIGFCGVNSLHYENGIHAYKDLQPVCDGRSKERRVVRVLLFGVTHEDHNSYRANKAIIVEALDWCGNRIPW